MDRSPRGPGTRWSSGRTRVLAVATAVLTLTPACSTAPRSPEPPTASVHPVPAPSTDATLVVPPVAPLTFAEPSPVEPALTSVRSFPELADEAWLARIAAATGIPERALRAYASAAILSNLEEPDCRASWNLLAALGQVESRHGEVHGGALDGAGLAVPAIFGVPLDGDGVASIPDSDAGALDDDATVDRAVGPLQFIPTTWRAWNADADGDGHEDPQDIDDASSAAAHYLCHAGKDLGSPAGWATAVHAWNRSETYLWAVATWAERYRTDALTADQAVTPPETATG